jgi:hypothetical protein
MTNAWAWWQQALSGTLPPVVEGEPQQGFYRWRFKKRDGSIFDKPVAIWANGEQWFTRVGVNGDASVDVDTSIAAETFVKCCKRPVSKEHYDHAYNHGGAWPGDLPAELQAPVERGIGDNSEANDGPSALELIEDQIQAAQKAFVEWHDSIGVITTEEQATLAGNYKVRFAELKALAEKTRKDEKEPYLRAGQEVDRKWMPITGLCEQLSRQAANTVLPFLQAEKKRRDELAAASKGALEAKPVKAGEGRGVRLRKVKVCRIVDEEKLLAWFATTHACKLAARAFVEKSGASAPEPFPGTEIIEEERAA